MVFPQQPESEPESVFNQTRLGKIPLEGPIPQTVQGDYDGDGKTDYAVYVQTVDPNDNPKFWVMPSNGGNAIVIPWGQYNWNQAFYNYPVASYNNR
jgi:hypothetical protein